MPSLQHALSAEAGTRCRRHVQHRILSYSADADPGPSLAADADADPSLALWGLPGGRLLAPMLCKETLIPHVYIQ